MKKKKLIESIHSKVHIHNQGSQKCHLALWTFPGGEVTFPCHLTNNQGLRVEASYLPVKA